MKDLREMLVVQPGGSLYGQWTSTGNPVVHVAISESGPQKDGIETFLFKNFRLCHIGEWRTARNDSRSRLELLSKYKGRGRERGGSLRFIVLEVAKEEIYPFLFVNQEHKGQGKMDPLEGENPFNRKDVFTQSIVGHNQNSYQPSAAAGSQSILGLRQQSYQPPAAAAYQGQRYQIQNRASQGQEARTSGDQWYAGEYGSAKLKYAFQKFQEIAGHGTEVEMKRDTETHNVSLLFCDNHFKKWEAKFPAQFPQEGAVLIDKSSQKTSHGSAAYETNYSSSYSPQNHRPGEKQMLPNHTVEDAVRKIVEFIKTGR